MKEENMDLIQCCCSWKPAGGEAGVTGGEGAPGGAEERPVAAGPADVAGPTFAWCTCLEKKMNVLGWCKRAD